MTDLVVMTRNRLPLLKRTLSYILERTVTPYRLRVIDDASTEGNAEYLRALHAEGKLASVAIHSRRVGIPAHLRALSAITASDPVVFTDDDVLCPLLSPDWLAQGLAAMRNHPRLGIMALNSPHCNVGGKRGRKEQAGAVTYCRNVPGTFVFVRRAVLERCAPDDGIASPVKEMCLTAAQRGWRVGYLTDVYCQHIGVVSARNQKNLSKELTLVLPSDPFTLEPPDAYKG